MGVRAYAIGEATIKLAADGKVYTVAVTAKKSAEVVTFGRDFADTEVPFYAGKTYEISLPRTVNGVKLDTDERRLVIKNEKDEIVYSVADGIAKEDEVVVAADATAPRLWTVKFVKAAKYTVIGEAFQSKKYDGTTAAYEATIEVKTPVMADVKQTTLNGFQIQFDGDANAVDMKTFTEQDIYYVVKDSVVPFSLLKEVKVDAEDNTKVNVVMHGDFVPGTEYFVKVGDVTKSFVASGTSQKDIETFQIKTSTVVFGEYVELEYVFLNKEGIDITRVNKDSVIPTFEVSDTSIASIGGTALMIYENGKSVTVKGTIIVDSGNEVNGYQPTPKYAEKVITAVPQKTDELVGLVWSVEPITKAYTIANAKDLDLSAKNFAIGDDENYVLYIFFKYVNPNGDTFYKSIADEEVDDIKVSDENFAVITEIDKAGSFVKLAGIKERENVPVILYKNDANYTLKSWRVVDFNVKAARKISDVNISLNSKTSLNVDNASTDSVKITVEVKDQYSSPVSGAAITIMENDGSAKNVAVLNAFPDDLLTNKDGKVEVTLSGNAAVKEWTGKFVDDKGIDDATKQAQGGSIVLLAEAAKNGVKKNSNSVGLAIAKKDTVNKYQASLTKTNLDPAFKEDTVKATAKLEIIGTNNGFYVTTVAADKLNFIANKELAEKKKAKTVLGDGQYVYTITLNGKALDAVPKNFDSVANQLVAVSGSALIAKADEGTYVFNVFDNKLNAVNSQTLIVKDTQIKPVLVEARKDVSDHTNIDSEADMIALVYDTMKITFNGTELKADDTSKYEIVGYDIVESSDKSLYIKSAKVRIKNTKTDSGLNGAYLDLDVNVFKLINGSRK